MSTTTNIQLNQPVYGSSSPTWDVPLNYNCSILDYLFSATTTVPVNTGGTSTYTNVTAPSSTPTTGTSQCMRIKLTNNLGANQTVLLPTGISGMWIISNTTTGSYTVTIASNNGSNLPTGGTTVVVTQGLSTLVYCDGTDVIKANDAVSSFSAGSTGLTPSTASSGAITLGGVLVPANGGTGLSSPGANGNILTSNGTAWVSSAPSAAGVSTFSAGTTGFTPATGTAGTVTLAGVLNAANGGTGLASAGANGNVLTSNGTTWVSAAPSGSSGVSSFSGGATGLLPSSATTGAITLSGTLGVTNGGTGNSIAPTNGQILIGNGSTYVRNTLTAGTGINVTNGSGTITIANTGVASATAGTGVTVAGTTAITISIGQSVATTASPSFAAITASTGNITSSTGNVTATAGTVQGVNVTATTGNVTSNSGNLQATAGKVVAGNAGHYLNSSGTGTATSRIWQVSTTASGDSTNTSIYWDNSALKYYFNPSGTNGCLILSNAEFACAVTPKANQTSWTLISDITKKKDITPVTDASQRIMSLNPVNFTWIDTEKRDSGFIAQEFETVYPMNISIDENGKKGIGINMNVYADLVSTIQTLHNKITDLEARLAANNI